MASAYSNMTRSGPPVPESIASDLIPQTFAKERTPYSQCPESIAYQPFAEKGNNKNNKRSLHYRRAEEEDYECGGMQENVESDEQHNKKRQTKGNGPSKKFIDVDSDDKDMDEDGNGGEGGDKKKNAMDMYKSKSGRKTKKVVYAQSDTEDRMEDSSDYEEMDFTKKKKKTKASKGKKKNEVDAPEKNKTKKNGRKAVKKSSSQKRVREGQLKSEELVPAKTRNSKKTFNRVMKRPTERTQGIRAHITNNAVKTVQEAVGNFPQWKKDNPGIKKHNQVSKYVAWLDIDPNEVAISTLKKALYNCVSFDGPGGGSAPIVPVADSQAFCKYIVEEKPYTFEELYKTKTPKSKLIKELAINEFKPILKKKHGLTLSNKQWNTHVDKSMKKYLKELFEKKASANNDSDEDSDEDSDDEGCDKV